MRQQQSLQNNETSQQITTKQKGRHSTGKSKVLGSVKINWESKVLHGQCIRSVDRELIGGEDMLQWLLWEI